MAVKIRLTRMGKIRTPQYRIVIADSRVKRDGKVIENVGIYHPKENPSRIEVKSDRVQHWLSVGAQPTDQVKAILRKTGDWQRFKGLPEPGPLKTAEPKPEKESLYVAALKESGIDPSKAYVSDDAVKAADTKPATKSKKSAEKADESAKTEEVKAEATEASDEKGE
ncbi:30S ribosomal protein S16 [Glycomyces scopariae]|uniref:Small ribosomal subunit protein bS16 n=1 Tax=Glycomyces sambucus TaxID=380244 RepID=A0A1G9LC69_9ACTN|nr:30S ribosomal protein S16 [Glycomyces sambucus]SDL59125.1 SSU ribosomal protein S16P [Glycomyces sambucus]